MNVKAALITGAAHRIGRALALGFAGDGWDIGLHYNNSARAAAESQTRIRALGARCELYQSDFRRPEQAEALVSAFRRDFPEGSLLINSASIFRRDRLASLEPALWDQHMTINALLPALLTRAFAAAAVDGICVINLLDQKVGNLTPDFFSYTVSKCALLAITRMLALELAPKVRVNAIAPGLVLQSGDQSKKGFERAFNATPLEVGPSVEELCRAAALIAESPAMTGQVITIDGGRHMMASKPPYDDLPKD